VRGCSRIPYYVIRSRPCVSLAWPEALLSVAVSMESRTVCCTASGGWPKRKNVRGSPGFAGRDGRVNEESTRRLPGTIETYRAALALARGDQLVTNQACPGGLDLAPGRASLARRGFGLIASRFWGSGNLEAGRRCVCRLRAGLRGPVTSPISSAARSRWRISYHPLSSRWRLCAPTTGLQGACRSDGPGLRGPADCTFG